MRIPLAIGFCLLSVALPAAEVLDVARAALRDGLWEVARAHAGAAESDEAKLIVLESLAGEGRWDEIGARLKGWADAQGDGFAYYRALVKGDKAAAMAVLKKGGTVAGCVEARLYEAEQMAKSGDRAGAEALWRELAAVSNVSDRVLAIAGMNLMDVSVLRTAYGKVREAAVRRKVGLRLGVALLRTKDGLDEGERLVRAIVRDSPDAEDARNAFLALADAKTVGEHWKEADAIYREALEIWPDSAKSASLQEGRGWVLQKLDRRDEALKAFHLAAEFAKDDLSKARALLKEGDVLLEMGRGEESMAKYREVMEKYPKTAIAEKLKKIVELRELEDEGRRLYREFRFAEAQKVFARVAEADSARRQRMRYFRVLCLYGQGLAEQAEADVRALVADCPDAKVRFDAMVWLAKLLYNRRDWKEAGRCFSASADAQPDSPQAAEALLWAARAALADNDFALAIQLSTRLADRYPSSPSRPGALLVQGEALIESARFDEAVLVFERIAVGEGVSDADRQRAQMLKADALYAMGADNPARYVAALEAYRAIGFVGDFSPSEKLLLSFKMARALEKLKRTDEAEDLFYTQVVLAYREGRLRGERHDDEARAAFSKAAFHLADEFENRGRDEQAVRMLELVAASDVPAAAEARRRIERISRKGRFL